MWGVKPDLSHLRVFGSVCYPLVIPASQRKSHGMLKYPSSVGVFLGYAENCPGAVVLDPIANKLSVRRDVVVDENYRFKNVDTNPTLHHINPAKIGPVSYPTDLQPISIATHTPPPRLLHDTASRYAVDICAGTCSALRFHLEQDPKAKVLAIDILPYHTVVAHIPMHLRATHACTFATMLTVHDHLCAFTWTTF